MNRWIILLCLGTTVALSLACSSGSDFVEGSNLPSTDVFDDPLTPSVAEALDKGSQVDNILGGLLEIRSSKQETYIDGTGSEVSFDEDLVEWLDQFDDYTAAEGETLTNQIVQAGDKYSSRLQNGNEESNDGESDEVYLNSFRMMKTEVTIQMFVDFLNAISRNIDELTEAEGDATSSFNDPVEIYKPVMQQESSCGIYRFEFGERQNDVITEFSGFYVNVKPTQDGYVDPYVSLQKTRSMTEGMSNSFQVAPGKGKRPMVYVTQEDAKEFCKWLGVQYRLPTWQEWEWAAKGGKDYQFATSNGNIYENGNRTANFQGLENESPPPIRDVGSFAPNPFGLYDMVGNVYEWTYFKAEDQSVGATIPYSGGKFLMGGSFKTQNPLFLTTWYRTGTASSFVWSDDLGFRVIFDKSRGNSIADAEELLKF